MEDAALGLIALVAGAVFCFSGYWAFRIVIPVWGAFAGFGLGAGAVSAITGDALLAKPVGWLIGFGVALVFATLAYLYFEVAVLVSMASLGFLAGSALMAAIGVRWNWLIVVGALALAIVFALVSLAADMPRILLVLVSAVAGATAVVGGAMLLTGAIDSVDLTHGYVTERIHDDWGWWVAYAVLVIVGLVVQTSRHADEDLRSHWGQAGGAAGSRA
ncbi:MAG: DUF4203 domain-containing protein [Acidimicrobiia bacterium]|nr:DUF4203 domain-containing protein [Acidimicrobiia bacterium]